MPPQEDNMLNLDTADFVSLVGWRLHRPTSRCTDWEAYLLPETIEHSGYRMEYYTEAEALALVKRREKEFCRRCAMGMATPTARGSE